MHSRSPHIAHNTCFPSIVEAGLDWAQVCIGCLPTNKSSVKPGTFQLNPNPINFSLLKIGFSTRTSRRPAFRSAHVAHNIGAILVQHWKQHWVNIVTNIDPIYACPTVFLYCANIGMPILCQYSRTNNGKPILARYRQPILAQYRKTVGHAYIGSILVTILTQYCFQCWTNIAPMLCATWVTSNGRNVTPTALLRRRHSHHHYVKVPVMSI